MRITRRAMIVGSALATLGACAPRVSQPRVGRIPVRGGNVMWRRFGGGSRAPILAIHGGPGAPSDYLEPLAALGDERPVFLWDQLGCGRSDRPTNASLWTLERFVAELDAVRNVLAPGPVHILGHSWGTMLAIEWLVTHRPADIVSVVFAGECMSVPRYLSDVKELLATLSPESQAAIAEADRTGNYDTPEYKAAYNQDYFSRYLARTPVENDFLKRTLAGFGEPVYSYMWGPSEFTCTGTLKTFDRTRDLASLKVPTLFHSGEFDECRPDTAREHAAMTPGAQFVMIPGAAHLTMIDQPDRCNKAIRDFLAHVEAAGSRETLPNL
jgi:proline iminopeptidase